MKTIGQTGEMIVFNRNGYAITSTKRQQNTFLKLRPKNENLEICLRQGNSTIPDPYISSFADYNGIEVIGTHGHIDTMGWCLVVKIDLSESLEPVNKLKNRIIAFASLIFIFGLTILNLLSSSITNPINKLTEEVDSITHGNLDMRLERSRIKEIQRLTESLNRILSSLKLAILRKGVTKEEIGLGEVIAAKEKAEMQKKEAEERYKTLFESSADAIMTLSPPDWRFKSANKATQKMFGVKDLETFLKYKPYDLSPARQPNGEKSKSKALKMIRAAMKDGTKYFKWTHKRLKGETFPTTVLLTRVKIGEETFLQATVRGIIREEKSDGYTPKQKKKKRGF